MLITGYYKRSVTCIVCCFVCLYFAFGLMPASSARVPVDLARPAFQSDAGKQQNADVWPLEAGKPIERELKGGQSHSYQIKLASSQYTHIVVDQKGIDVAVRLFGPDGKLVVEVDSPNGTSGPEPIIMITEAAGVYNLEISSLEKDAQPGLYEAALVELRYATQQDKQRVDALKMLDEAARLQAEATQPTFAVPLPRPFTFAPAR